MLSEELTKTYGKGFSVRDLWLFKQFYLTFNDLEILHTRVQNLTWSHYRTALRVEDPRCLTMVFANPPEQVNDYFFYQTDALN